MLLFSSFPFSIQWRIQGRGPGGRASPLFLDQKPPPPPPQIWRSVSATGISSLRPYILPLSSNCERWWYNELLKTEHIFFVRQFVMMKDYFVWHPSMLSIESDIRPEDSALRNSSYLIFPFAFSLVHRCVNHCPSCARYRFQLWEFLQQRDEQTEGGRTEESWGTTSKRQRKGIE